MSDKILKALMQLFAIIANAERLSSEGRNIVELFLKQQISSLQVLKYLEIFDGYFAALQGKSDPGKTKKRISVNSVKVLRICTEINGELDLKQKYIVLIRLIEFAHSSEGQFNEQELEFLSTVASVFNISHDDYNDCLSFASAHGDGKVMPSSHFLYINNALPADGQLKHIRNEGLEGELLIFNLSTAGIIFAKYFGQSQITLNGNPFLSDTVQVLSPGSVIRGTKMNPVYYSDVVRCFMNDALLSEINLTAKNIEYAFKSGKKGLRTLNFSTSSGNLVGIMGGSGAGKSTLLNILNGNLYPSGGAVLINSVNIHKEKKKLEGVIGFVPQDDLLMEDLSVFQNLFYNSKLCFGDLDDHAIIQKVNELMDALGLSEIKDLRVGDALNNSISGGQRKRLNIALELIRTPSVLFVDEPTSGLSSLDSENVMDLLKQLAITGKLVFVVIHQPSSDIFKLFDKLLILDIGGYPIYFGNPSDSLIYFKQKANYADANVGECETCGNINSEQIFSIIESKLLDEFGNVTANRKFSPPEWNRLYNEELNKKAEEQHATNDFSGGSFKKPSKLRQISVFIQRDLFSKLRNTQYLLINFLEAPFLAFILSYLLKYFKPGEEYIFRENLNVPAYIFMSVIVALFMGLTVSAEEIIRDRKILKRESFLNLSRSSYLVSKISVMFLISAIQTFSFVIIGNTIFEIKDMSFEYWLVLFTVSSFANMAGLNISSAFDSAVTIYILIPFLIIPQIMLSGVMVKFEDLNPSVTTQKEVPFVGEMMASRWAFEALAVNQFKNNRYERNFFDVDMQMSNATYKKDFWLQKMNDKLDSVQSFGNSRAYTDQLILLNKEVNKELHLAPKIKFENLSQLRAGSFTPSTYQNLKKYFEGLKKYYIREYNEASEKKDSIVQIVLQNNQKKLGELKNEYTNESLGNLVMGTYNPDIIIESKRQFIQRFRPVFMQAPLNSFIRAQLFVYRKMAFGNYYDTWMVNIIVIWLMSLVLAFLLYFDALRKMITGLNDLLGRIKIRRKIKK